MTLPVIDVPTYDLTVPSTGEPIKVRPFLVKEEKVLLMALESKDDNEIVNATKQIIKNCILEGNFDVDKAPFFDVDYLFIALRAKSVGESLDLKFVCNVILSDDGRKCNTTFNAKIDIANVEVEKDKNIKELIELDKIKIKMKYPNYSTMKILIAKENALEKKIKLIAGCISEIQKDNKVFSSKDYGKEEVIRFVGNLTEKDYKKLEEFVDNLPSFAVKAEATCPKCGYKHNIKYKEFTSFFQ